MPEQRNDEPEWVPYQPPPPSGKDRVWRFIRRASFPLVLLLFVAGLGALLYLSPQFGGNQPTQSEFLDPGSSGGTVPPSRPDPASVLDSLAAAQGSLETSDASVELSGSGADTSSLGTGYANLSVYSEPSGATVLVDGDSIGVTPLSRHSIRSGVYIISVQHEDFFSADTVAILRNDQGPIYSVTLTPRTDAVVEDAPVIAQEEPDPEPDLTASAETLATQNPPIPMDTAASEEVDAPPQNVPAASDSLSLRERVLPRTGTLRFVSTPTGAVVRMDGDVVGTTPLTLAQVEAGIHNVEFTQEGHDTSRTEVTLAPQEERTVQGTLNQLTAQLRVLVQPWGSIYIDGELYERNADVWFETSLPVGEHEVTAVHPALGQQVRTITLTAGEERALTIDLRTP